MRGNRKKKHRIKLSLGHFSETDERSKFCLKELDFRIHFALNCGFIFDPSSHQKLKLVDFLKYEEIEENLEKISKIFVEKEIIFSEKNSILFNQIFKTYLPDFLNGTNRDARIPNLLITLKSYLSENQIESVQLLSKNLDIQLSFQFDWKKFFDFMFFFVK